MVFNALLATAYVAILTFGIARIESKIHERKKELGVDQNKCLTGPDDDCVEDVEYREVEDEYETLKKDLKALGNKYEDVKPYTKRCIADLELAVDYDDKVDKLYELSGKNPAFKNIEEALDEVQDGVFQNARDILLLLEANIFGKRVHLEQYEIDEIERELKDNQRRLDKFKDLLRETAKFAMQRDDESSDLFIDSWIKVMKQLNHPIRKE